MDNRVSFAVVVTDNDTNVINSIEVPGTRYIDHIVVSSTDETVILFGQANETAVLALDVLSSATVSAATSPTGEASPTESSTVATNNSSPGNNSTSPSVPFSSSYSNTGAIAGSVVGGVVVIVVALVVLWWLRRRKQRRDNQKPFQGPERSRGQVGCGPARRCDYIRLESGVDRPLAFQNPRGAQQHEGFSGMRHTPPGSEAGFSGTTVAAR